MDKAKKKRIKRYITWVCMAGMVLLLTVMPLLAKSEAEADGPQASVLSATAETGSITLALHGGGTLEDEDAEDAVIPTGVKITEFLVKNGDIVKAGDPVAKVDKTSVMAAITAVNETMDYIQQELEDGRDETVDANITAVPGGRVKKVFAGEGESVQDVMLRDGALAVLSIDSMMAVQYEIPSALATGETVEVTLGDGTAISGRVESNLDGKVVITVEDEGYEVGQEVKVEGLGTGILYIHNAWKATGISGSISRIHAKEEQTLNAGANLFTIDDRDFTGQLQYRANQHREYEELLQTLLKMYQSGTIDAPCEGIVSGVVEDSVHLLAAEGDWEIELLAASGQKPYKIVFLAEETKKCTGLKDCEAEIHDAQTHACMEKGKGEICPASAGEHTENCIASCTPTGTNCKALKHEDGCVFYCAGGADPNACKNAKNGNHKPDCILKCSNAAFGATCSGGKNHYLSCIESCHYDPAARSCPATGDHQNNCIKSCVRADYTGVCKSPTDPHYEDCIEACNSSKTANDKCPASKHKSDCHFNGMTYTAYAAMVYDVGSTELLIYKDNGTVYTVEKNGSGWRIVSPQLNVSLMIAKDKVSVSKPTDFGKNDIILLVTAYKDGKVDHSTVALYQKSVIGNTDVEGVINGVGNMLNGLGDLNSGMLSGMLSGMMGSRMDLSSMMGGFAGYGNYAGMLPQETESLHDLEGSPLLTVTPHRTMNLTISLDEQDISKVSVGMEATVKVEALKHQEFPATVTKVGIKGINSSGSSKFQVQLRLEAAGDMLPGMSASATIPTKAKEDILLIPVDALAEQDGKVLVYTALDTDSGEPASPVEVVTGVSDGKLVEILSGLSQGDTVYYSYYDTLELDTSAEAQRFTFG